MKHNHSVQRKVFAVLSWLAIAACLLVCPTGALAEDSLRPAEPFDDVNLFGPFMERPNSRVGRQGDGQIVSLLLSRIAPGKLPQSRQYWLEYRGSDPMNTSDWLCHYIDRTVYDFGTPEKAAQALEDIFSRDFEIEMKRELEEWNSMAAAGVETGEVVEVRKPEDFHEGPPGKYRRTDACLPRRTFSVDTNAYSKAVHFREDSLLMEVEREVFGNRKEGGAVVYNRRILQDSFPYQQESLCFLPRGRHILFACVGVKGNRRTRPQDVTGQGPFALVPEKSIFPGRMWQQVLAIMRGERFDDPSRKWEVPEDRATALCMTVAYMRRRAKDVQDSDPGLSQILAKYAGRIQRIWIHYQDKAPVFNKSGEASYWNGTIYLYGQNMNAYEPFKFVNSHGQSPSDAQLGYVASVLIHEAAHASGADEWQAHKIQQRTFDVLGVSTDKQIDNIKYFKRFPVRDKVNHPVDYICSQFYWMFLE